jgi:hypothetical protein
MKSTKVTLQRQLFKPYELNNWCKMVINLIFGFGRVLRLAIFSCFFAGAALFEPANVHQRSEPQGHKRSTRIFKCSNHLLVTADGTR